MSSATNTIMPQKAAATQASAKPGYKHTKLGWIPEEWEVVTLGRLSKFLDGRRVPLKDSDRAKRQGPYPYYGASGIIDYVDDFLFDEDLILLGEDGANILTRTQPLAYKVTGKVWVNNHAHVIRPNAHTNLEYLVAALESIDYTIYNTGTAQPKLNKDVCEKILVRHPPLREQRRIAAVLGAWDRAMATVHQLLAAQQERKRGLMQELLTGRRRFKGFQGKWKSHRLGDLFERVTRKNTVGEEHVLTISAQHGLIDQREIFSKSVAGANLTGYYLLKNGEFAYNKSSSNGYPVGAIKRLDRYEQGILSVLYICFALKPGAANSDFMAAYFDAGMLDEGIGAIAQEGARNHGLLNVSTSDFFDLDVHTPEEAEQEAIAKAIGALNKETETIQNYLDRLTTQKRGLMQQLLTGAVRVRA